MHQSGDPPGDAASDRPVPQVRVALDCRDLLGEGPAWNPSTRLLTWVDILGRAAYAWAPSTPRRQIARTQCDLSAVIARANGGLLLAAGHEILAVDPNGVVQTVAIVEDDQPDNRFNDCRCDPQGRLWAGTMHKQRAPGQAALYRMTPGEPMTPIIVGTTLSNGIGWSPAGELMYFIDSTTQQIDVFDFDGDRGDLRNRRCFAQIAARDGLPDGLAVDAEGAVWVCLFGGGAVRRYDSTGTLDAHIRLPASNPTCPAFGGQDLATLYITTARHRLTPEQLLRESHAGALLALEPGVTGLPVTPFAG
jgi:sugar lactone lactonase YvrE